MSEKKLRRQLEGLFSDLRKPGAAPAAQEPAAVQSAGVADASELDELRAENERLKHAVQERETAFQAFLDEIPVGYHELDAEGRITQVNHTELAMLGYTAEEMVGRPAWEFVAESETSHQAILDKLAGQLALKPTEREFVRKDGTHASVLIQDKHLLDAEGNIIGIRTTVQDISERKRVEESLHRQNMELAALHETTLGLLDQIEPAHLIEMILSRAAELAGTEHGYLYVLEPGEQSMVVRVGIGAFADLIGYRLKRGQGVAGKAWEQNAPVIVGDYQTWEGRQPGFDWLHAVASIPLHSGARMIGVISLGHLEHGKTFGPEAVKLLERFAELASVTLANAQILEETGRRITDLSILNEIGRQLASALSLEDLYRVVRQQVSRIFDTSSFFIGTFEMGSDHWQMAYRIENGQPAELGPRSLEAGLGSYMIKTQEPLMFNSAQELDDFYRLHQITQVGLSGTKSWMGVPLITAGRIVGVMAIQNYEQEHLYDEQGLKLFSTIGAQTAVAIQNARLFEETQMALKKAQSLYLATLDIANAASIQDICQNLVTHFNDLVQADRTLLALVDHERKQLTVKVGHGHLSDLAEMDYARLASGISGLVLRSGQPVLSLSADDGIEPEETREQRKRDGAGALIVAPLIVKRQVIGTVTTVNRIDQRKFTQHDVDSLMALATQAAISIDNLRLFEETSRRAEEMAALNDLGQRLASQLDLSQVLDEVYQGASRLLDTSGFYIALYHLERNEVSFAINVSESAIDREITTMPADQGLTGYIIRNRASLLLKDNTAGWLRQMGLETVGEPAQSWLGVPMMIGDQMLGVISVQNYTTPGAYDEHDQDLLVAIANQAAIAVQNARLFEETRTRARELAALNEMGRTLSAMLDINAMINQVYNSTGLLMDTTNFFVALYDARLDQVSFPFYAEGNRIRALAGRRRGGKGLTEYVIRARAPLLIEEHVTERLEELGIESIGVESQSWLGVPMLVGDQVIGVVAVQSYTAPRCYDQHHRDLLVTIASQAAIAIQNARLFEETRARAEETAALNDLSRALTEHLTLEGVLEEAYRGVSRLMNTNSFAVALYDQDKDEITFPFDVSEGQHVEDGIALSSGRGMTGYLVRQRRPLLVKEGVVEWRAQQGVEAIGPQLGAQSWLGVPMTIGDRVLGVLIVQSYSTPNAFNEHDQEILVAIANQTAIALQNARLFEQTQVRARRERILREVTTRVRSSTDPDTIVRTAVRELGTALGRPTFIRLGSAEQLSQGNGGDRQRLTPEGGESNEAL